MLPEAFNPFVDGSPTTVMAAAAITRLLSAARLDAARGSGVVTAAPADLTPDL